MEDTGGFEALKQSFINSLNIFFCGKFVQNTHTTLLYVNQGHWTDKSIQYY
mgnify:CR=1 FL=1